MHLSGKIGGRKMKYIYNVEQANFYMEHGVKCLGTGVHYKTKMVFYKFKWEDTVEVQKLWSERGRKIDKNR